MVEIKNRVLTTKQAKQLQKMFDSLGISLEDLYEIINIKAFKEELRELRQENLELKETLELHSKNYIEQNNAIHNLNVQITELTANIQGEFFGIETSLGGVTLDE